MAPALEPQRRQHLGSSFPLLAVVATLAVLAHGLQPAQGCAANGTNKAIQEMMTARCLFWQYDEAQVHPSDFSPRNCTLAWERFYSAFRFKAAAATTMADYGPFATYMSFRAPENRSLFWTGTGEYSDTDDVVHTFSSVSDGAFVTLEDTLGGSMANGLQWCGSPSSSDGIDYDCCPQNATLNFWAVASSHFAMSTTGSWSMLARGYPGRSVFGQNRSFFERFELPNIPADNKGPVTLMVIRNTEAGEYCSHGSIGLLQQALIERFGAEKVTCIDNPEEIDFLLCASEPASSLCLYARQHRESCDKTTQHILTGLTVGGWAVALVLLIVTVVLWLRLRSAGRDSTSALFPRSKATYQAFDEPPAATSSSDSSLA